MSNVQEAVPKSVKERIFRRTRTGKKGPTDPAMKGRVVPKKTGNNVPRVFRHGAKELPMEEETIAEQQLESGMEKFFKSFEQSAVGLERKINAFTRDFANDLRTLRTYVEEMKKLEVLRQKEALAAQAAAKRATSAPLQRTVVQQ